MAREYKTLQAMIRLYCRRWHGSVGELCAECSDLRDYARERLRKCPFQEGKTTCAKCPVHCYRGDMRQRIRVVMRYAGPRILYRHPVLALLHFIDARRKKPLPSDRRKTG
ncbi:MAG TPA: nitrous oxide-stimulated promoter family protein [Dehalococcoidia bacterium]|nr:nitrous oxide-stimulated promoter family protein [Dehalococcoidia bacterium]